MSPWALDSGGFSEITLYGSWVTTPEAYADEVRRWSSEAGMMDWAAAQDWMCEPHMVERTGLSLDGHQARTVANYLRLREIAPEVPWCPVVQGFTLAEYLACVRRYEAAGVRLDELPTVGVGSICRRQGTTEAADILRELAGCGLKIHAFGLKLRGLQDTQHLLRSADSMAWSLNARKNPPMAGCTHRSCANCYRWAMRWRERVERLLSLPVQRLLWG